MSIDARLDVIELVVADMAASLAFYRRLGLDIPADADAAPHVEFALPGGLRLAWDAEDTIRSFIPDWTAPEGGNRTSLAPRSLRSPRSLLPELNRSAVNGRPNSSDVEFGRLSAVHGLGR